MADLTARIKPKKSSTTGEVPQASDLEVAELAVNTADGKLFVKHTDDSIKEISGGVATINDLTDVDSTVNAQGYQHTQGSFFNDGEFQLNGTGLLIDFTSQNGLGDLPQPADNGSLWFSTSEYGPFTELVIVGNIGLAGSTAYSIPDFVDRSPLDAVLTGSTVIYFHTVDPVSPPADGQVLTWVDANSQWEPKTLSLGVGNLTDVETGADALAYSSTVVDTFISWSNPAGGGGFWQNDGVRINREDGLGNKDTTDYSYLVGTNITIYTTNGDFTPNGSTTWENVTVTNYLSDPDQYGGWYELEFAASYGAAPIGNYYFVVKSMPSPNAPSDGEVLTWVDANGQWEPKAPSASVASIDDLTDVDTTTSAPTDGQVLTWDDANSQWEPADAPGVASNVSDGMILTKVGNGNPYPAPGTVSLWSGSAFGFPLVDARGIDFQTELYAASNASAKVYHNGALVYDSTTSNWSNKNSNRLTITFADTSWWSAIPTGATVEVSFAGVTQGKPVATNPGDFVLVDNYGTVRIKEPPYLEALENVNLPSSITDGDFLGFDRDNAEWVNVTPMVYQNTNVKKARSPYGEFQYVSSNTTAPPVGQINNWSGTSWIVNVTDLQGINFKDAIYALSTAYIPVEVFVNGVSVYVGTIGNWGNKDATDYTFNFGSDTWKAGLVTGDIIRLVSTAYQTVELAEVDGQALTWNATRGLYEPRTPTLDDLADVDTSTAAPTDGQVLTWDNANGQWEPATPSGSIQTADDFELNPGSTDLTWSTCLGATTISNDPAGSWGAFESGGDTTISIEEASDQGDVTAKLQAIQVNDVIAVNGTNRTVVAKSDFLALQGEMRLTFDGVGYIDNTAGANTLTLSAAQFATGTTPLVDGDILQYVAADSAFKPAKIPVDSNVTQAGTGANSINNLVTISQVDYDALGTPDANTVYFIV